MRSKPRICITGGAGLLALNWAMVARGQFDVTLCFNQRSVKLHGTSGAFVDLQSVTKVTEFIAYEDFDFVVHTAGFASVDMAEKDKVAARAANVLVAEVVALATNQTNTKMIHVSTDHLFNGSAPFANELMPTTPVNVYGETKAEGEKRVLSLNPRALIVRTNFFGWGTSYRASFSDFILSNLRSGKKVDLYSNVYFTPIIISKLASISHELVNLGATGIFNVVGSERLSKYDFGVQLAEKFGLDYFLLQPKSVNSQLGDVVRPSDMSLSTEKLARTLGHSIGVVDDFLNELKAQELSGYADELQGL
jgi:dTDP-4-dehydrorhamnose reductase